jgi:hypothetical protein
MDCHVSKEMRKMRIKGSHVLIVLNVLVVVFVACVVIGKVLNK